MRWLGTWGINRSECHGAAVLRYVDIARNGVGIYIIFIINPYRYYRVDSILKCEIRGFPGPQPHSEERIWEPDIGNFAVMIARHFPA